MSGSAVHSSLLRRPLCGCVLILATYFYATKPLDYWYTGTLRLTTMAHESQVSLPVSDMAMVINRNLSLTVHNIEVTPSPPDGHCLLHSICESWNRQLSFSDVSLETVKHLVFQEAIRNRHRYVPFVEPSTAMCLTSQMRSYLLGRRYNNSFCDVVPLILSNTLAVNIIILQHPAISNSFRSLTVTPWDVPPRASLVIYKKGDHYDAVSVTKVQCHTNSIPSPSASIPSPLASMPSPLVPPSGSASQQSSTRDAGSRDKGHIVYSSQCLRGLQGNHRISRKLRKRIFVSHLWKQ